MKRIIINADDYGLSSKFNQGILELINQGIVTSVSVMINRRFVFPKELLGFSDISIGLHLESTEGDNLIYFDKQIKKFKKIFGVWPSHLDGHLHCHLKKENRSQTIELAKKYNIPVRSRFKKGRLDLKNNKIKTPERFFTWNPKMAHTLLRRLRESQEDLVEVVCHPGYFDPNYLKKYNKQREKEMIFLKSAEFNEVVGRFEKINYNYLK